MPFDPSTAKMDFDPTTAIIEEDEKPQKKHWLETLFPTASEEAQKPLSPLQIGKTVGKFALDAESIPTRAAAALTGQKMSDPTAYALKPLVKKIGEALPEPEGTKWRSSSRFGGPSAELSPEQIKSGREAGLEMAGSTLSDPLFVGGLLKKPLSKAMQGTGKRIEESVLGKGSKKILREQKQTLDQAVTGALEHGLGGDMAHVIKKGTEIADDLEEKISSLTKNYNGPKRVNVEYQFYKARKYIDDHPDLFLTDRNEVLNAIDNIEKNFDSYGLTGNIPVDQAQQLKRSLKVKGIPNQTSPASQDAIFGLRMAFADAVHEIVPEIDQYNQVYREIMPALRIAADRMPTEQARDIIGLGTLGAGGLGAMLSGGPAGAVAGKTIYDLTRSGKVAQGLYNTGKGLNALPPPLPLGGASVGLQNNRRRY